MRQFVSSMNGWMVRHTKSISRSIRETLSFWWKNTALEAIRVVFNYDYRFAAGAVMWALRQRWHVFKMRLPAHKRLHELEKDYWHLYDEWAKLDLEHRSLYMKYQDLNDEVRYWETRHAKIMNYVEKKMELDDTWGK